MGQKVNAHLFRLGPVYNWSSRWFAAKGYKDILLQDVILRKFLVKRLEASGVSQIEIERSINSIKVIIHVSRPGMVIGRAGTGLEDLKKIVNTLLLQSQKGKNIPKLEIRVEPIKEPSLDAYLVAKNVSDQIAKRLPYKRVLNQTAEKVMSSGAKGVRIALAGRIAGSEIGRREKIQKGTVPLSTIREHVHYASVPSLTKKGYVGVKVWINVPEGKS